MERSDAITFALNYFDSGACKADLARLVAIPTESQNPERAPVLSTYLADEMGPIFAALGFNYRILTHPAAKAPFLFAERFEGEDLSTIFGYGHGDVVHGLDQGWSSGLSPWILTERGDRWYGRGVADNKGQLVINLIGLRALLACRGRLGFNAKFLIEMGEETGSPGLRDLCSENRDLFRADVLVASDGPRISIAHPTIFLGSRGIETFDLAIDTREGSHHSGNWGGLLSDPAVQLMHAVSTLVSPAGQIRIHEWVPRELPAAVRRALVNCEIITGPEDPRIDPAWGEPGLSPTEQLYGWCSFDVLAMKAGDPETPSNAIPGRAWARCQLRYVVGVDPNEILPALRRHLDRHGFDMVKVSRAPGNDLVATRLEPDDPWVDFTVSSLARTTGRTPTVLPNIGGSLPNDVFANILKLRTIWVPHSYPGCSQHAPNEHLPIALAREGVAMMTGLYWDIGSEDAGPAARMVEKKIHRKSG